VARFCVATPVRAMLFSMLLSLVHFLVRSSRLAMMPQQGQVGSIVRLKVPAVQHLVRFTDQLNKLASFSLSNSSLDPTATPCDHIALINFSVPS
jgi:hypothetical protein